MRIVSIVWSILALSVSIPDLLSAQSRWEVEIEQAETPPVIDADLGDWAGVRWHLFAPGAPRVWDHVEGISRLQNDGPTEPPGTALTGADLSGHFALQWDDEWIYLAARVTDNVHDVSGGDSTTWWNKDAVNLFLDIPLDGDGLLYHPGDHTFSFIADPTYPEYGKHWRRGEESGQQDGPAPPETRLAVRLGEEGYTLEAALPMTALARITPDWIPPFADRTIGFMFLVTDPDGGPEPFGGQLAFGGQDDDDSNWTRLRFSPGSKARTGRVLVSGKVTYQHDGSPWAGGEVRVVDQGGGFQGRVTTVADGHYQIEVPPGAYRVQAGSQSEAVVVEKDVPLRDVDLVVPPTLARLSFQVPPERRAIFEAGYAEKIAPLLQRHGLVPSESGGWGRVDTVFSRLFVLPAPDAVIAKRVELEIDPAWRQALEEFGVDLETTGPDGIVPVDFHLYAAPSTSGQTVPGGPGVVRKGKGVSTKAGTGQRLGAWLNLGMPDGLPHPIIMDILQDGKGYLWLGTEGGVSRYDGSTWITFTTADGLQDNTVRVLLEDRKGNLWVGAGGDYLRPGGVSRYDGSTWTTFTMADGLGYNMVNAMVEDRQGNLWFGTVGGASHYNGSTWITFTVADGLAHDMVNAMVEDRQGNLWFGTESGVSRYDGERFTTFTVADGLAHDMVNAMVEDRQGNLWFGTEGGVSRYDGERFISFTVADGLVHDKVNAMVEDREGNLWFGTESGVSRYDGERFTTFTMTDGLVHDAVLTIVEDREGNLWFGTESGVSQYSGGRVVTFTQEDGLASNLVHTLLEDRTGTLWLGTRGGLQRHDGKQFITFVAEGDSTLDGVVSILEDHQGDLWFGSSSVYFERGQWTVEGTGAGLSRYDGERTVTFTAKDGLFYDNILSILEDRTGLLWFGTFLAGGKVSQYDGKRFSTLPELGLIIVSLLEDRQGNLWFGTGSGVRRYNGGEIVSFTPEDSLVYDNFVYDVLEDRQGHLWFATEKGVARYDGEQFTTFTTNEGLTRDWVVSMLEDRAGHLWFGTMGGGVSRYDGFAFQHLSVQDGLASNLIQDLIQTRDGDVWIATEGGLTRDLTIGRAVERVRSEALSMRQRDDMVKMVAVMWQELKDLGVDVVSCQVAFLDEAADRIVDYVAVENPRKQGISWTSPKMVEVNEDIAVMQLETTASERPDDYIAQWRRGEPWSMEGNWDSIEETHRFTDRLGMDQSIWTDGQISCTVVPFAYGSVALNTPVFSEENVPIVQAFTEALSLGYIRYLDFQWLEEARLAADAANQAKSAFLANMSHELRTPLNSVIAMSDILLEKYFGPLTEDQEGYVTDVRDSGHHLLELINEILDLSKIEAGYSPLELGEVDLGGLLENSLTVVRERAQNHGIELSCELTEDLPGVVADERKVRQVVFNLLSNAVKFTPDGGRVGIAAEREGEEGVRVCVWDTGIGITAEDHEKVFRVFEQAESAPDKQYEGAGLGLALVERFVEQHGGRVWLESAPGEGSRFFFTLPLEAADARVSESEES